MSRVMGGDARTAVVRKTRSPKTVRKGSDARMRAASERGPTAKGWSTLTGREVGPDLRAGRSVSALRTERSKAIRQRCGPIQLEQDSCECSGLSPHSSRPNAVDGR